MSQGLPRDWFTEARHAYVDLGPQRTGQVGAHVGAAIAVFDTAFITGLFDAGGLADLTYNRGLFSVIKRPLVGGARPIVA